ncbi:hypothetical protein PMAYCL1PPCAC_18609 [Pristionchus mayeri]|uniref:receptor protein serine/threonine kinase n=1 Tax=Pristionchus mayeri TaxID=1317129 RepID=A0AAN5CQ76_9BILA|nr:hypothetical protein PMAYCL1PPCAC_18609 [Pristionchus mayeri]
MFSIECQTSVSGMRHILIPLLLFSFVCSLRASPKFDDDEDLFENLNKSLPEIYRTKVEDLTLRELSAALGVHIPEEHRETAEYLLKFRDDRPVSTLMMALQKHNTYSTEEAEEFSRGAMRALLDKSYMISQHKRLQPGDHLCRCNQRECASVHNELYAALGPEMSSFCRVDKYGYCIKSTRYRGNNSVVDLYCAYSYATEEQKEMHTDDHEHLHVCMSTKMQGRQCCKGAMCNDVELPLTDPQEIATNERWRELTESRDTWKAVGLSLTVLVIILLIAMILTLLLLCKFVDCEELKKKLVAAAFSPGTPSNGTTTRVCSRYFNNESTERGSNAGSESPLIPPSILTSDGGTTTGINTTNPTSSFLDMETTQGVGTGMGSTLVAQCTISSYIRLMHTLGQGKFGKVFLGEWRGGEKIAVKKFDYVLYDSFMQEVDILMSGAMSNSNILRWIGKDTVQTGSSTEYWIMSEYHPNGSLFDYLEKNALSQQTYLIMMRGIANGISFLHSEIPVTDGTSGKKGVAHRDLKTKNILVKSDLTCVIADFGMAVINEEDGVKIPPGTKKSGTVRYLAPEVLTDEMTKVSAFEYYRASDMYSFALILWECARRTHAIFGKTAIAEYSMDESLAYYSDVPREPSVADMKEAVVEKDLRPPIDEMWNKNPVFFEMSRIMRECWSTNSTARLTALNVKIVIDRLSSHLNLNLPTGYD